MRCILRMPFVETCLSTLVLGRAQAGALLIPYLRCLMPDDRVVAIYWSSCGT